MKIESMPVTRFTSIQLLRHHWKFALVQTKDADVYKSLDVLGVTDPRYMRILVVEWTGQPKDMPLADLVSTTLHEIAHALDKELYDLYDSGCYHSVIAELSYKVMLRYQLNRPTSDPLWGTLADSPDLFLFNN